MPRKDAAPFPSESSEWHGYARHEFRVRGRPCQLVVPKVADDERPWIWRTEFFGHEPQVDLALLSRGWHVAHMQVSDLYGVPRSIRLLQSFQRHLESRVRLAPRAVLEGFSRGGLYAFNYAVAYPDKVAALYLDAPVLDIRSWPGGRGRGVGDPACWAQCLDAYGLTEETAATFRGNPLDRAEVIAKAGIPIIAVCGDADDVVPYDENTAILKSRYRELGGVIKVILKRGCGHHPHSLVKCKPIVDFILGSRPA